MSQYLMRITGSQSGLVVTEGALLVTGETGLRSCRQEGGQCSGGGELVFKLPSQHSIKFSPTSLSLYRHKPSIDYYSVIQIRFGPGIYSKNSAQSKLKRSVLSYISFYAPITRASNQRTGQYTRQSRQFLTVNE